jgi:hypothetical protein
MKPGNLTRIANRVLAEEQAIWAQMEVPDVIYVTVARWA